MIDGSTDHSLTHLSLIYDLLPSYLSTDLSVVPNEHDVVDMLQILTELTMPSDVYEEYTRINKSNNTVLDDPISRRLDDRSSEERSIPKTTIVVIEGMMYDEWVVDE